MNKRNIKEFLHRHHFIPGKNFQGIFLYGCGTVIKANHTYTIRHVSGHWLIDVNGSKDIPLDDFIYCVETNSLSNLWHKPINAWTWLRRLHDVCQFQSREGKKYDLASSSELKRWFQQKCVIINGQPYAWDQILDSEVKSLVLFPKSKKVTVF